MARSKRLHKYYRIELCGDLVWACAHPDCNHHMPKHQENILKGKRTICWKCDEPVAFLDETNWIEDKPLCDSCRAIKISTGEIQANPFKTMTEADMESFMKSFEEKNKKVS